MSLTDTVVPKGKNRMPRLMDHMPKIIITLMLVGGAAITVFKFADNAPEPLIVGVSVPELSAQASAGADAFAQTCAACHGANGTGSDKGPPLIHDIYNPGHHGDEAFYLAVKTGTRQHHWTFGNMPPQPQVAQRDIANIIAFVREMQRANGIFYRQHIM